MRDCACLCARLCMLSTPKPTPCQGWVDVEKVRQGGFLVEKARAALRRWGAAHGATWLAVWIWSRRVGGAAGGLKFGWVGFKVGLRLASLRFGWVQMGLCWVSRVLLRCSSGSRDDKHWAKRSDCATLANPMSNCAQENNAQPC